MPVGDDDVAMRLRDVERIAQSLEVRAALLQGKLAANDDAIREMRAELAKIREEVVSQKEYWPVRSFVVGLAGLMLVALVTALLSGVVLPLVPALKK